MGMRPRVVPFRQFLRVGKYKVRLFDITQERWRTITVDDNIPTRHGNPIFAKPNGKELWVVLLEKAVAKFCGSYSNIAGGFEAWGLKVLTGNHVWTFRRLKPARPGKPGQWRRYEFLFKPSADNKRDASSVGTEEVHERVNDKLEGIQLFQGEGAVWRSDKFWGVLLTYAHGRKGAMCCSITGPVEPPRDSTADGGSDNRKSGAASETALAVASRHVPRNQLAVAGSEISWLPDWDVVHTCIRTYVAPEPAGGCGIVAPEHVELMGWARSASASVKPDVTAAVAPRLFAGIGAHTDVFCLPVAVPQSERVRKDGLIENHAYSIMRAIDMHGEKLIQIRNPWVRRKILWREHS
ncbi:unnamed protein product [Ectocarpus sp. CCAP 1310/34]|nr:unnamed protein product [Ectocarpus sp. CCAP 1310/34]